MATVKKSNDGHDITISKPPEARNTGFGEPGTGSPPELEKGSLHPPVYITAQRLLLDEDDKSSASDSEPAADIKTMNDDEIKTVRDGFAVYEPPPISEGAGREKPVGRVQPDSGKAAEWSTLGQKLFESYGDTLKGPAGYMGPIGGVLAGVAAVLILLRLAIESAYKIINSYVMIISTGAFIIGVFLLVFHLFHWLSNRNKSAALAEERKQRLVVGTCKFLDVRFPGKGILLKCKYFTRALSNTPECVVCARYDPAPEAREDEKPPIQPAAPDESKDSWEDDEGAIIAAPLSTAKPVSKERQLLMEMDVPKIGGASGGDLDEEEEKAPNLGRGGY
jgi:hypothetical protein